MTGSSEYKILLRQLGYLREYLLPRNFDPTGSYSNRKRTRALAYRVLAHAEIESYFEERAAAIVRTALAEWKASYQANSVLLALLAFSGLKHALPPETIDPPGQSKEKDWDEKISLDKRVQRAARPYFESIKNNHGIRERNILRLLLPIGFHEKNIDPIWLADIDSFGKKRGVAAHTSSVTHLPDPHEEYTNVRDLLTGIEKIDEEMFRL